MTLPMDYSFHRSDALRFLAGPIFLGTAALAYNVIAYRRNRPTISEGVRWLVDQGGGAEVAGAVIGGLIAHWLLTDGKADQ